MTAWITRHLQTLIGALGRLSQHKLATFLTTLVIGIALALPACLHLLIANAQTATGNWNRAVDVSVYFKMPTSVDEATRVAERLRQRRDVAEVDLVTADDALKEFRRESGFGAAIDALTSNPLPHALVVRPKGEYATAAHLEELAGDIRGLPSVELVQLDTAWVNRLQAILEAVRRGVVLTAALLALGVMAIVGNTIRLDIQNRRAEIEVTKLVGGSNAFVRRPFLYSGVWYGIGGAVIAWLLTAVVVGVLRDPVSRIAGLYGSGFQIQGLAPKPTLILLGAGIVLGWLGSYIAASRHLRQIEPS
ncbi:MAG TPA: permease-like cell division protein FtsX [Povalibacter sp.]|nr:permease-like cell division protein FtsX [Povalibacter sp.]